MFYQSMQHVALSTVAAFSSPVLDRKDAAAGLSYKLQAALTCCKETCICLFIETDLSWTLKQVCWLITVRNSLISAFFATSCTTHLKFADTHSGLQCQHEAAVQKTTKQQQKSDVLSDPLLDEIIHVHTVLCKTLSNIQISFLVILVLSNSSPGVLKVFQSFSLDSGCFFLLIFSPVLLPDHF